VQLSGSGGDPFRAAAIMLIAASVCLLAAYAPTGPAMTRRSGPLALASRPAMSAELSKGFSRAEFWTSEKATWLDVVNVMGRWESSEEWRVRTEFVEEGSFSAREETILQGLTEKRYAMAQRLGMVERTAFFLNLPRMPFRDAKLAASVGKTVEEFNAMPPPSISHCNLVYDALAESKSGLIPPAVVDQRRQSLLTSDGGLDDLAFALGLYKARFVVILSWFLFGKGQILGFVIFVKVFILDALNLGEKLSVPQGLLDAGILIACVGAAIYAALAQADDTAAAMAALDDYEMKAKAAASETAPTESSAAASA